MFINILINSNYSHPFKNLWTLTECEIWKLIKWISQFLFLKILMDNVLDTLTICSSCWIKVGFEKACSYCNTRRCKWKSGFISVYRNGSTYMHKAKEDLSTKEFTAPGNNYRKKGMENLKNRRITRTILVNLMCFSCN